MSRGAAPVARKVTELGRSQGVLLVSRPSHSLDEIAEGWGDRASMPTRRTRTPPAIEPSRASPSAGSGRLIDSNSDLQPTASAEQGFGLESFPGPGDTTSAASKSACRSPIARRWRGFIFLLVVGLKTEGSREGRSLKRKGSRLEVLDTKRTYNGTRRPARPRRRRLREDSGPCSRRAEQVVLDSTGASRSTARTPAATSAPSRLPEDVPADGRERRFGSGIQLGRRRHPHHVGLLHGNRRTGKLGHPPDRSRRGRREDQQPEARARVLGFPLSRRFQEPSQPVVQIRYILDGRWPAGPASPRRESADGVAKKGSAEPDAMRRLKRRRCGRYCGIAAAGPRPVAPSGRTAIRPPRRSTGFNAGPPLSILGPVEVGPAAPNEPVGSRWMIVLEVLVLDPVMGSPRSS